MGKAYEMDALLDWAEGFQKHSITPPIVMACENSGDAMMNIEAQRLDRELWSFLNLQAIKLLF